MINIPLENRPLFLNKFNPTLKIICSLFLLALIFIPVTFVGQLLIFILIVFLLISSRLPKNKIKIIFRSILFLFIFVFLINWLVSKNPGIKFDANQTFSLWCSNWNDLINNGMAHNHMSHIWISGKIWGGWVDTNWSTLEPTGSYITWIINNTIYYLSYSSPWYSLSSRVFIITISTCLKLFCMLSVFSLIVNTTSTLQLTYAFEHILWPLKWIKVPVTEISYIIAVAIRFVPTLFDEANKLIRAQASRGRDFKNSGLVTKIKTLGSIVIPMFSMSFNRADKISDAMEARNFIPRARRTKYKLYHCSLSNWLSFVILIALLGIFIYLCSSKVIIYPFISIDCFNI